MMSFSSIQVQTHQAVCHTDKEISHQNISKICFDVIWSVMISEEVCFQLNYLHFSQFLLEKQDFDTILFVFVQEVNTKISILLNLTCNKSGKFL